MIFEVLNGITTKQRWNFTGGESESWMPIKPYVILGENSTKEFFDLASTESRIGDQYINILIQRVSL
jgi:hypothetical protein